MIDIHDYDIQCIEHEILWKYDKSPCDYPDCDCLLSLRKDMINERVLAHQKEITKKYEPFSHALIFFFFPEDRPLLMEELKPFSDWIESVPGELRIKWGMATQSTQELRAIVLLQ